MWFKEWESSRREARPEVGRPVRKLHEVAQAGDDAAGRSTAAGRRRSVRLEKVLQDLVREGHSSPL